VLVLCATIGNAKTASAALTKVIFTGLLIRISPFLCAGFSLRCLLICLSTLCCVSEKKHGEQRNVAQAHEI
jgi:hypothetical protein